MPEEGFFRAGRTRPGPNVHGARTGPPPADRPAAGRRGVRVGTPTPASPPATWPPCAGSASSTPPAPTSCACCSVGSRPAPRGSLASSARRPCATCWTAGRTGAWSPATACSASCGSRPRPRRCGWSAWTCAPGPSSSPNSPTSTPSGVVRLALEPSIPAGGRWLSERELRREAGKSHVPDAAVQLPDDPEPAAGAGLYGEDVDPLPKRVAVEVELTRKGAARLREAWTRPRHGRWTRTVYYAPPEVAGYLTGQLARIRPRHPIQVHPLPEVAGVTYLRPGGAP